VLDKDPGVLNLESRGPLMTPPQPSLTSWQKRPLLYTVILVVTLIVLCFTASLLQIYYIHDQIEREHKPNLSSALNSIDSIPNATNGEKFEYARWKTLASLEANDLENEYHQANIFLLSKLWVSYLGAITGMILALVGAAFMLGRLREAAVNAERSEEVKSGEMLQSSMIAVSPGLIFALIGTVLILTSLFVNSPITIKDNPKYTKDWLTTPPKELTAAPQGAPAQIKEDTTKQ
jgi:hypothetical protein